MTLSQLVESAPFDARLASSGLSGMAGTIQVDV
jgi:hypothetical protein